MQKKKMSKGKIIVLVVIVFLLIGVISGLVHNLTGTAPDTNDSSSVEQVTSNTEGNNEQVKASDNNTITDFLTVPTFSSEQNTSAMVDEIASVAKDNVVNLSDDQANEIIDIIRNANHQFYNGPEEMEKYMWYGYLLDYKYDDSDPRSELGMDLCQAIKYVYRDAETVLDDATHENLSQIDKDLEQIQ